MNVHLNVPLQCMIYNPVQYECDFKNDYDMYNSDVISVFHDHPS